MTSPDSRKRRDTEFVNLMMKDFKVQLINDSIHKFDVEFHGPKGSLYEGGVWKVHVELPEGYPIKSPSIGFADKIFHPNVDEKSGSVCLNVLNQEWSAASDLLNVFQQFLPQLLLYPNPNDPLNAAAASLMKNDEAQYEQKVREYCELYAKKKEDDSNAKEDENSEEGSEDSEEGSDDP